MEGHSSPSTAAYTASGISSTADNTSVVSAFVTFKNNQVIHTAGNGISVLNGHDITADGNRIVSCGQDTTGAWFSRAGVAAVTLWNRPSSPGFTNDTITNTAGSGKSVSGNFTESDIFVFPTLGDEWGVVVNESLSAGRPVLGSVHSQAVNELIHDGINGWKWDPEYKSDLYNFFRLSSLVVPIGSGACLLRF